MRIMKSIFGAAFAVALTLPMAACGGDDEAFEEAPVAEEEGAFEDEGLAEDEGLLNEDEGLMTEDEGLEEDGVIEEEPLEDDQP